MSLPRQVLPGCFYQITRRCSRRQFLLRPDPKTNAIFEYCVGVAAQRNQIDVLNFTMMSNHYHMVIFDRYGNYPAFLELFHTLVARMMNAYRKRSDHFWTAGQTSVVHLPDVESIIGALVYTLTNPTKHLCVERIERWPGANGYAALVDNKPIVRRRPAGFFRVGTDMEEKVTLPMTIPPELGDREAFIGRLKNAIELRLLELANERNAEKKGLIGANEVMKQHWEYIPPDEQVFTKANRNKIKPRFASKDVERRKLLRLTRRKFLEAYYEARAAWLKHQPAEFPVGTYYLARYSRAPVATAFINEPVVLLTEAQIVTE